MDTKSDRRIDVFSLPVPMLSRFRAFVRLATLVCCWVPLRLLAQGSDAMLLGRVRNNQGTPITAASVTIINTSTGGAWHIRTNEAGRFTLVELPLGGPYTVTVQQIGYRAESRGGYLLTLAQRTVVEFALQSASVPLATIDVVGRPTDSPSSLGGGNHRIDARAIAAMPTLGRNFTDLAALAPTTGVQLSMLGQRWTSTDIRIDGVQSRNMLRAGELGAGPFTISLEAIRAFEVSTTVYDVAQGRQGGGSIRAATRSGTNTWQGSVFSYYRGSALAAATDFQAKSRSQRQFDATQWGGSTSGPLVRDRAHLFFAFDRQDSNEPLFTGVNRSAADERANGIARDSLTRLTRILARSYGLDTSRAQIGRLDRRPIANSLFARVDWRLNAPHQLTVTHNLNTWNSPLSGGVDLPVTLYEARSNYESREQQTVATLRSVRASGLQNELLVSLSSSHRSLTPNSVAPRGFVRIQSRLTDGSAGDARVQFGGNRLAPDESREAQWQVRDRAHWQRGATLLTVGTDNTLTHLATYIAESQSGLFEFQSLSDLEQRTAFRYSRTLPLRESRPSTDQRVLELGAFAQAEWQPAPRVTATLGLRWDGSAFLNAPLRNALIEQQLGERTDRRLRDWTKVQPRAQLVWEIDAASRNIVRVGGGRFAVQPIYYLQHNQLLNDGTRIADITLTGSAVPVPDFSTYRRDANTVPGLPVGASAPAAYVNLVDTDFRAPSVWKGSASFQRRFGDRIRLTASWVGSRTLDNYMYVDRNLRDAPAFTLAGENNRPVFVPAATIDAAGRTANVNALANPQIGRVLKLSSVGRGRGHALIADAAVDLPDDARVDLSYTVNSASDNSTFGCCLARTATTFTAIRGDPRDLSGSWGPSDTDFRHKLVVVGSMPAVWGVRVSGRYVGMTGRPFSAVVNGDINGDEATSNDLAFVFDPDNASTPAAVAASMRRVLNNPDNIARQYLSANLGRVASRNGAFAPWTERIDVRIAKVVPTSHAQALTIALDIFNVANLLNAKWGAEYQLPAGISNQNPVVQRVPLLNVVGFTQATKSYVYTVNETFGVLQKSGNPYQMQLSLRYGF